MDRTILPTSGKIWNVEVSDSGHLLALEIRDEVKKKVLFSIYDLRKEEWLWDNVEFEENWWINLLLVTDDRIYLNYFTEEHNPEAKKIIEVDVGHMEVLNELKHFEIEKENKHLKLPLHYKEGTANYNKVVQFIEQHSGHKIVKAVDYLQTSTQIIISYYLYMNEKMVNYLLILDNTGEELINEQLAQQLTKVGMHTFFYVNNFVITVKNKTELVIFKL